MSIFSDKDEEKEIKKKVIIEMAKNIAVEKTVEQADKKFGKPEYNPQTRRQVYDDGSAHKRAKEIAFSEGKKVRDPYSQKELTYTKKEAKEQYGANWQDHLAEADHIVPLNKIVKEHQNDPWITAGNLKEVANSQNNYQILSTRTNQTGGKGGSSQKEWSQDDSKMKEICEKSGIPKEYIVKEIQTRGENAEKQLNKQISNLRRENIIETAHDAGKKGAIYTCSNAAIVSSIYNIVQCVEGKKTGEDAIKDICKDSLDPFLPTYINNAGLTVLNRSLTSSKSNFIAMLGKNNIPGKAISAVTLFGDTIVGYGRGELDLEDTLCEVGKIASSLAENKVEYEVCLAGSRVGVAVARVVIPIPVVQDIVGDLVGGVLASVLYENIRREVTISLIEQRRIEQEELLQNEIKRQEFIEQILEEQKQKNNLQRIKKANTEKEVIESIGLIASSIEFRKMVDSIFEYSNCSKEVEMHIAECVLIEFQLQEYRKELQRYAEKYSMEFENCFDEAFDLMDEYLNAGYYEKAIDSVNQMVTQLHEDVIINNTEDFSKLIFGSKKIKF